LFTISSQFALAAKVCSGLFSTSLIGQIATPVELLSRYLMLVKVAKKDAEKVFFALFKHARKLPQKLHKTFCWHEGMAFGFVGLLVWTQELPFLVR